MIIHWFRKDLRINDNPALSAACEAGKILPIYIYDEAEQIGAASKVWLHYSLESLNKSLENKLLIFKGNPKEILQTLISKTKADSIYWNRCYEAYSIKRDKEIKESLFDNNVEVKSFNGSLLWEPWENLKDNNEPYKVFTAFYKKAYKNLTPREILPKIKNLEIAKANINTSSIANLKLLPNNDWYKLVSKDWKISEEAAHDALYIFIREKINNYKKGRDFPSYNSTSRLSPYLHFGQISPNQIWYSINNHDYDVNKEHFLSEIGWREFSYNLLYHFPNLPSDNLQNKFNNFPWEDDFDKLKKWQKGQTGYPIVDAGMRELYQTGYMHNRVRMIVASFLVKNLLIHWHHGQEWFWDCLFDADLANNSASWQWVAGSGADAAPYFRIFNPITQGEKFDPDGTYTKKYVPELKNMPNKYLFKPFEAPQHILEDAKIELGKTYPKPIVNVKSSREKALDAYKKISSKS